MPVIRFGTVSLAIALAASIAACTATPGQPSVESIAPATAAASTEPSSSDEVAGPPAATLGAEGGDPVTGQLGTYVWAGGGSDSPWLRGAAITVGAGEPLTVAFQPTIEVASWSARSVVSTASGPSGARSLGQGTGSPRFEAPEPGSWTIEVRVEFADGAGSASYFWQLTVT